jgi:hypothetical protein
VQNSRMERWHSWIYCWAPFRMRRQTDTHKG